MTDPIICLGIDPGYGSKTGMGWALVAVGISQTLMDHGVIQTPAQWPWEHRVASLGEQLAGILARADAMAIEDLEGVMIGKQMGRGAFTSDRRTQVTADGPFMLAAAMGKPYCKVLPSKWRIGVGLSGRASKEEVRSRLVQMLGLPPRAALHASDAAAIAVSGARVLLREINMGLWVGGHRKVVVDLSRAENAKERAAVSRAAKKTEAAPESGERRKGAA